jgi:hypothetical protein
MSPFIEPEWSAPASVRALLLRDAAVSAHAMPTGLPALPGAPHWLRQVHGIDVVDLDARMPFGTEPEADAAISRVPGVVCAIRTADCLPVIFAARDGSVVGAAHAGWRGLVAGVLEATISKMRAGMRLPVPLVAWLGPAIGPANFEVGDEVRAAFVQRDPAAAAAFVKNARGRWQCDLYQLARQRLEGNGVSDISGGGLCTYADPERFHSYRRALHQDKPTTGRMATLIWIESAP